MHDLCEANPNAATSNEMASAPERPLAFCRRSCYQRAWVDAPEAARVVASQFQLSSLVVNTMRLQHTQTFFAAVFVVVTAVTTTYCYADDPLPSWNDTAAKQAIIEFVNKVATEGSPDFVPPAQRIATFDNDGTLWSEKPMYFQLLFALDRVKQLAPQHPEWKTKEPFASLLKGDLKVALADGEKSITEIVMVTHAGITTDQFEKIVTDWIATARHPQTGKPYTQMVYQPMLELLAYLRATISRRSSFLAAASSSCDRGRSKSMASRPNRSSAAASRRNSSYVAASRYLSDCLKSTSSMTKPASQSGSTPTSAAGPSSRPATPTAICKCCSTPPSMALPTTRHPALG